VCFCRCAHETESGGSRSYTSHIQILPSSDVVNYAKLVELAHQRLLAAEEFPVTIEVTDFYGGLYSAVPYARFKEALNAEFQVAETITNDRVKLSQFGDGELRTTYRLTLTPRDTA
jgi:3-hydroxy-3-methylglutaryl CoA synthase